MENLEIIFRDIPKIMLDKIWKNEFNFTQELIISSHFCNENEEITTKLSDIKSYKNIFSPKGNGYITLSQFDIGIPLGKTIISFAFDEKLGDIDINFRADIMDKLSPEIRYDKTIKILKEIVRFSKEYSVNQVYFGYEPADDNDMCLLNFKESKLNIEEAARTFFGN